MNNGPTLGSKTLRWGAWAALMFLVLPALVALPVSLTPKRFLSMPTDALSLKHYANLLSSPEWLSSIWQSLVIALFAATIATVSLRLPASRIVSRITPLTTFARLG